MDSQLKQTVTTFLDEKAKLKKRSDDIIELELSLYKVNQSVFTSLYNSLVSDADFEVDVITRSLDVIVDNLCNDQIPTTYRREMGFSTECKTSENYIKKYSLSRRPVMVKAFIDYKIKVSKEEKFRPFEIPVNSKVRAKIRTTFINKSHPNWKFDLTMVKYGLLSELGSQIHKIKSDILTIDFDEKNIFEKLPLHEFNLWEVEAEWISDDKPTTDDLNKIEILFPLISKDQFNKMKMQEHIYEVAKEVERNAHRVKLYKTEWGLKRLLNQVIGLTKQSYRDIFPPHGMFLTEKTDGFRCLLKIDGKVLTLLYKRNIHQITLDQDDFANEQSFLDAEIVLDHADPEDMSKCIIKIFDVIKFRDELMTTVPGRQRIEMLPAVTEYVNAFMPGQVKAKSFRLITEDNMDTIFKEVYESVEPKDREGLILMSGNSEYSRTKNYKWKDFQHNTVDFLARIPPAGVLGNAPFNKVKGKTLYLIFVGVNNVMRNYMNIHKLSFFDKLFPKGSYNKTYGPTHFSPSGAPLAYIYYHPEGESLDNRIIELQISKKLENIDYKKPLDWKFVQVRTDRQPSDHYFGNDIETAETTFQNYFAPFKLEDLPKPNFGYFADAKTNIHDASNKFKRFIGTELILKYAAGANWVLDIGGGRGADLQRYQSARVKNVLFAEVDPEAINELILRKYTTLRKPRIKIKGNEVDTSDISTSIYTLLADLNQPALDTTKSIQSITGSPQPIMNFIMSNFSLHYMCCGTTDQMKNLISLVTSQAVDKTIFAITVMDGQKVFDKLKTVKTGDSYQIIEDDIVKYSIRKNYAGDKLAPVGQSISVKLPFSDEMYDEPLVNCDVLIEEFEKAGFNKCEDYPFTRKLNAFKKVYSYIHTSITTQDKEYIELHRALVFKYKKQK